MSPNRQDPLAAGLNGLEAHELPERDSDFALLEHFGVLAVPAPADPNRRAAPAEVPDWTLQETEPERIRRVLGG